MSPFEPYRQILAATQPVRVAGRVHAVRGLTVGVSDFAAAVGAGCRVIHAGRSVPARVVGFAGDETLVMPIGTTRGIRRGDRVVCSPDPAAVGIGPGVLGRVLDGFGRPIDGGERLRIDRRMPIWPEPMGPLARRRIAEPLPTGVRAIDAMLTIGRGQRMGIFSGSGVGKSVLLGMIARHTAADVSVIALIGERGREVREFIERDLGEEGLRRAVVVVSTSDQPPLLRVQGGAVAAAVAEYYRDQGKDVLLLMDSLTRLAMAQREIGLAAGEPPAARGYTPSVFDMLPHLLERSGRAERGSVTGFYTVLVEDEDAGDPVGDAVRAVTDGHIHLSRPLAHRGHFPAVDVPRSVSRVMLDVADDEHLAAARAVAGLLATWAEVEDMVSIGAYQAGASREYDLAIELIPAVREFLAQDRAERADPGETRAALLALHRRIQSVRGSSGESRPAAACAWRPTS